MLIQETTKPLKEDDPIELIGIVVILLKLYFILFKLNYFTDADNRKKNDYLKP